MPARWENINYTDVISIALRSAVDGSLVTGEFTPNLKEERILKGKGIRSKIIVNNCIADDCAA